MVRRLALGRVAAVGQVGQVGQGQRRPPGRVGVAAPQVRQQRLFLGSRSTVVVVEIRLHRRRRVHGRVVALDRTYSMRSRRRV